MACEFCCGPDFHDYGFDLPDIREKYYAWSNDVQKTNEYGDIQPIVITLTIKRQWGECECGSGEGAVTACHHQLTGDDGRSLLLTRQANTLEAIQKMYPNHDIETLDIWEGEKHLRMMEMGLHSGYLY